MKHIHAACAAGLYLLALSGPASLAEEDFRYNLDRVLREGLEHNLDLRASYLRALAVEQEALGAEGIFEPQLQLQAAHEDSELPSAQSSFQSGSASTLYGAGVSRLLSSGTRLGAEAGMNSVEFSSAQPGYPSEIHSGSLKLTLSQDLLRDWGGGISEARVEAARKAMEAARLQHDHRRQELAAQLYEHYWMVYQARLQHEITGASVERARSLLERNRAKQKDGLLEETEVLAAEAALASREADLVLTEKLLKDRRDLLARLMGLDRMAWDLADYETAADVSAVQKTEVPSPAEAFAEALANRSDLAALRASLERAVLEAERARLSTRPELMLDASYGRGGSGEDPGDAAELDRDTWSVGVKLSSSLTRRADRAAAAKAQLERAAVDEETSKLQQQAWQDCRGAHRQLQAARTRVGLLERARSLHEDKLRREEQKLQEGRSTTDLVVRYLDDLDFAELALAQALAEAETASSRYLAVQGRLLAAEERP